MNDIDLARRADAWNRDGFGEINGWVARCAECLAATPPPPGKE